MGFYFETVFLKIGMEWQAGLAWFARYAAGWKEQNMFRRGEYAMRSCQYDERLLRRGT
jgi:hypothetical protein